MNTEIIINHWMFILYVTHAISIWEGRSIGRTTMDNGWIKLHRKIIECGFFNNPNLSHFWVWCLLKATHDDHEQVVGFQKVVLKSGDFIFGRKNCASETGLSEQTVRTCVNTLIKLENLTIKSTNKYSIVTICKWGAYQKNEETTNQQTNKQTTNKQPTTNHKQECKEQKNVKKAAPTIQEFTQSLKTNPAYSHIDIDREILKATEWRKINRGIAPTPKYILGWMNRIEAPLKIDIKPIESQQKRLF